MSELDDDPRVTADSLGLDMVLPGPRELFVDLDRAEDIDSRERAILRIALQACLGSDRKRELLSLLRILFRLDRPPTVFFERPGASAIDVAAPTVPREELPF